MQFLANLFTEDELLQTIVATQPIFAGDAQKCGCAEMTKLIRK